MRLIKIGRDSACDIVISSPMVSSLHAEITVLNNGDIMLEDKNSRNGTFVMNRPIQPGTQVSVKRGDAIRFGDTELIWDQVPKPEDLSGYKGVYGIGKSMRNDIQVNSQTASRYHATLKIDRQGRAWLQDHSKNGTTVNGQRIGTGQTVRVKRGDRVECGGNVVDLSNFIPVNRLPRILTIAGTVAAVGIMAWGIWAWWKEGEKMIDEDLTTESVEINPATPKALENASACVYGAFYYEVTVEDDPFKDKIKGWPEKWYVGLNEKGELGVALSTDNLKPFEYRGTAFFISDKGELGTNRHVAVPWEYRDAEVEENIRQAMAEARLNILNYEVKPGTRLKDILNIGNMFEIPELQAWELRYKNSPIKISGNHEFFGLGLTEGKVDRVSDLEPLQVIAESGTPDQDVALIRINNPVTPQRLVNMGAVYDISQARVDENELVPQKEELTVVGYPYGTLVSSQMFNGQQLHPTIKTTRVSQRPDQNIFQIQATGISGMSGSPVSDPDHRLVGVLCSGFNNTDITYCVNIKHLVDLYNKHGLKE